VALFLFARNIRMDGTRKILQNFKRNVAKHQLKLMRISGCRAQPTPVYLGCSYDVAPGLDCHDLPFAHSDKKMGRSDYIGCRQSQRETPSLGQPFWNTTNFFFQRLWSISYNHDRKPQPSDSSFRFFCNSSTSWIHQRIYEGHHPSSGNGRVRCVTRCSYPRISENSSLVGWGLGDRLYGC